MNNRFHILVFASIIYSSFTFAINETDSVATYTIAVTDFTVIGLSNELQWIGESCADGIRTKLVLEKNIRIVERQYLSTIIDELKFQESGLVNEKSAVELGKLIGAKYFILGSVSVVNTILVIRARMVNVESAEIVHSSEVTGTVDNIFQLQTELARNIAIKILGNSIIQNTVEHRALSPLTQSIRSKLNKLKKLSESLSLFALDPARKRKAAEYTTAGIICDGIIESYPELISGYYYKALFSMHAEDYEETEAALSSAKSIDPNNLEILLLRSMYLFHLQKYQEAKILLTYVSAKYPRDSRIWFGLAKTSARLNDYSTVIESLVNAIAFQPYIAQAEPFLQSVITQQQSSNIQLSHPIFSDVVSLFQIAWGSKYTVSAHTLSVASSVMKIFPDLYISYFVSGKIHELTGNNNSAIVNYQRCLELVPQYPPIHRELAYFYLGMGSCMLGKQHAALYMQTSNAIDDFKDIQQEIQRCR